jgi:predicted house-cleaning noncanonical NTP pyrophosphatase (MazG superfamily)
MRWPKVTLSKHGIIRYERKGQQFFLNCNLGDETQTREAISICDAKIEEWIEKTKMREKDPLANESVRYRVLRNAGGKCELCGIPSSLRPIDIDHVIPQSKADRSRKVMLHGKRVNVNAEENLQALCSKCNRAKRDADDTDFRRQRKLVRDGVPDLIRHSGRTPRVNQLSGSHLTEALYEKLVEEHEEYIQTRSIEELADMAEVILTLARRRGTSQEEFIEIVTKQRIVRGGFTQGYIYAGDEPVALPLVE